MPPTRLKNFTLADQLGSQLFTQFFNGNSATVIGVDESWVVQQLKLNGHDFNSCSYNSGNDGLYYCINGGRGMGFVIKSDGQFMASNPGSDGTALLAHEYFHLVQYQMADLERKQSMMNGGKKSQNLFPAWFAEGSANFVGFSVAALAMDANYWTGRKAMFTYAPQEPSTNRNVLKDYEIRNGPGNNSPTYPYVTGQVATEFIVASVGFQKMLDIWILFKETQDFGKSFERATGLSKDAFYDLFEKARLNLDLPEVTWKLNCLTNTALDKYPSNPAPCSID